jgi:signal transduction histidine kinase/AraC-like DNA-binding protein
VTGIGSWRRPDGRKNLYEWSAVRAAVGDRVYQFGIDRDITEHIALLRGMRDALLRFQRSEGEAGQYVRAISEDLGRPVGELVRELRSLAGAEGGGGSAAAPLGRVLEHAEHLNDLLGGLTAYAEAGGAPVPARPVPAADCLGEAVRSLAGAIAATGASVIYDALPELPVPRLELVTVFENLLDNAIKFRDGRPPVIEIGHRHQSDGYLFWVRDNGRGFRAGDSMQAFRLFERLHDPDRYPGKGLGLALCRKIVESRGGRVWAESEPGQGATIFFTLPGTAEGEPHRAEIEELAQQMRAHPYRAYDLAEHSRRMHISHGYFRQLFRRYAHRSPYAYLITWRMRQAARDLRDPHRPVKSIALAAGYTDPAQFSKTFRKQIGASPSEFRHRLGL